MMSPTPPMDRRQMTSFIEHLVSEIYEGRPVPPAEGGLLFRTVCERCRERGDLFWTESRLHDLARELGYWPWSVSQIEAALRRHSTSELLRTRELSVSGGRSRSTSAAGTRNTAPMKEPDL